MDAILAVQIPDKEIDLHMIEIMEMQHKTATETNLVKGTFEIIFEFNCLCLEMRTSVNQEIIQEC